MFESYSLFKLSFWWGYLVPSFSKEQPLISLPTFQRYGFIR